MTVTSPVPRAVLLAFLFIVCSTYAVADTQLNITIQETVHQNVSFAENFNLVENRSYALIDGVITVTNPDTETIYDIYLRLDNVSNLESTFTHTAGRNGYQVIYPDGTDNVSTYLGEINNTAWYPIGRDLDEDGVNDFISHNSTHLLFNLTSEYELSTVAFYNSSDPSIDISSVPAPLNMSFNLTSVRDDTEYNVGVNFAQVTLVGNVTSADEINLSQVTLTINDTLRNYGMLHVPELRAGDSSIFIYTISSTLVSPPLDIDSFYTNPEFETKVLSGEYFLVQLVANNIATVGALQNVNITLQAENTTVVNGSASRTFNFTLHNLSANTSISGDYTNVDNSSNRTWSWEVNGGTIAVGASYNITFKIRAPDTVATSGTHLALTQSLQYEIPTTASTLAVGEVRARAATVFNTTKRIVSPSDNESNTNVTWQSTPRVTAGENITFTLERVSLWVTDNLDPNDAYPGLEREYTPNTIVNLTQSWTGSPWLFNFTDGSAPGSPPPIVWIKPYWIIRNTNNQIVNSSVTVNGTDLYMNYIYVVNGYWLEVQKQVLDAGDDSFNVLVTVQNRGNGYTPQNLTVTIYDFIPAEFTAFNFSPIYNAGSNVTGEFAGTAYQWDVGLRTNLSTSFAPRGDAQGLDFYTMNYSVNGTGDFRVSDLYIVGLDPRLVDGQGSSHNGVSIISSFASTSREMLYAGVVVMLLAINIANFMMTSRINRKLTRK